MSEIFRAPAHYTRALTAATSCRSARGRVLARRCWGELPNPAAPPPAACSAPAPHAIAACAESIPVLRQIAPGRRVACLRAMMWWLSMGDGMATVAMISGANRGIGLAIARE